MNKNLPTMKLESITLSIFLIVVANFILGIILAWPQLNPKNPVIPQSVATILVMIFFFAYYLLFLFYLSHYVKVFKEYLKGNEIKFIIWGSGIGIFGLAALSYWKLGLSATLSWFAPTVAIFLLDGVLKHFKTKDKRQDSEEKTPAQEKK